MGRPNVPQVFAATTSWRQYHLVDELPWSALASPIAATGLAGEIFRPGALMNPIVGANFAVFQTVSAVAPNGFRVAV
jgi:hypothetical protein